jgi:hypoxanthine phosphoribosyltransferase
MSSSPLSVDEIQAVFHQSDCLKTSLEVDQAYDDLALEVGRELGDCLPLILCVMNGGLIPAGRLLEKFNFPLEVDYIHATRYRGETSGGGLKWIQRPQSSLEGRHVLIIDDIFDEGITLNEIVKDCKKMNPLQVYSLVLVDKLHQRKPKVFRPDFIGLTVEDRYLFGCGMDYLGYLRNINGIFAINEVISGHG